MANDYYPLTSNDACMHLKEPTLGTYKALKMISLGYVMTPVIAKKKIMQEFKLPEDMKIEELGVEDYYKELFQAIFLEGKKYKDVEPDSLNIAEINRAYRDFFTMLNGN